MTKRKKKKMSPIKKFLIIVASIVCSFLIIFIGIAEGYIYISSKQPNNQQQSQNNKQQPNEAKKDNNFFKNIFKPQEKKINVALFGVDKDGTRTDVIIVGSFNTKTKKIDLISVPRDTRLVLSDKLYKELHSRNSNVTKVIKLNELHAYAGRKKGNEYSVGALEEILGIDIDHYVKINYAAFRKIVDIIGGVTMYVPRDMKYSDPYQNLYINIHKGTQRLNGAQAEQVVRFRKGYSNGDLGRINMQQRFIKAFIKQVLRVENILKINDIISTVFENVQTDLNLKDILVYSKYVPSIKPEYMDMYMIPGQAKYMNGRSFFIYDKEKTKEMVQKVLDNSSKEIKIQSSKGEKIEVLNGGNISGLASKTKERLKVDGYNIASIGNYKGNRTVETRIIVNKEGLGQDLKDYFVNSKVIVNPENLPEGIDIQIIVGLSEK